MMDPSQARVRWFPADGDVSEPCSPAAVNRLVASVEAAFMLPVMTSSRPVLWVAGQQALKVPFVTVGTARRYQASLATEDFPVVTVGRPARFRRLLARLLEGHARLEAVSPRWPLWNPARSGLADVPLVAVEIHPLFASRFRSAGWLICPESVRWQGSLSQIPPATPSRSLRSDLSNVSKRGYTLQVAAGSKLDWEEFTETMLIPYAERRFADNAWILPRGPLRQLEARGKLLFLIRDGRRMAGMCVLCSGDEIWVAALGVRDGDINAMRAGAIAGLYALTIDWARGIGMQRIDAGRTPAFIHDGLVHYKHKWGLSPVPDPLSHLTAVRLDPAHRALRLAIAREPFWIAARGGGLQAYPEHAATGAAHSSRLQSHESGVSLDLKRNSLSGGDTAGYR